MSLAATTRLGPYEIVRPIGAGGMGEVYEAHDPRLDRIVAIKILPPEFATDAERCARFAREARAVSALNHPNIVAIYDVGTAAGTQFLAMEYVPGEPLHQVIARGTVPVPRVLDWSLQVADALAAAHAAGIVHGDVKPANLLVAGDGRVKVVDFGLSRRVRAAAAPSATTVEAVLTPGVESAGCGTPGYVAPEVIEGGVPDKRSDVFSLGCVMYELAAGTAAFAGSSPYARLAATLAAAPPAPRQVRREAPAAFVRIVTRCLARDPAARYASAADVASDLHRVADEVGARRVPLRLALSRWPVALIAIVILLVIAAAAGWYAVQRSRDRWVREVALPEATRLLHRSDSFAGNEYRAFRLLRRAAALAPSDPQVRGLLKESTSRVTITTDPAGADVYARAYTEEDAAFERLGRTPLEAPLPTNETVVLRATRDGFHPRQVFIFPVLPSAHLVLKPHAAPMPGMTDVQGGRVELFERAVQLGPYSIGTFEVTNREFARFVAAGGYDRAEWWSPALSMSDIRARFRDRTGRMGPATWEVGTYADGRAEHPVAGVSWYEASAYCRSIDGDLPTIFHWYDAANLAFSTQFASFGNFNSSGTERVGHRLRMGANGTYDMAGNVKEWTSTEAGPNRRYLLGGGWRDGSYAFRDHGTADPSARSDDYGFRCAAFASPPAADVAGRVTVPFRDYRRERPIDDRAFSLFEGLYRYDPTPLDARQEARDDSSPEWVLERVSYRAAYGGQRIPALLVLPRSASPPYQVVVVVPGGNKWHTRFPFTWPDVDSSLYLFMLRSGRALLLPMYYGTYDRYVAGQRALNPHDWREIVVHTALDLKRSLDYLTSRRDVDATRLAYYGPSLGAGLGPLMTAVEPRFRASVLLGGGLFPWRRPPEVDPFNFLPRVAVPTLMINGRHDYFFTYETSQVPMFERLGAREKRHRVFDSGHLPSERAECIRETLDWLDKYLGPVQRR